MGSKRAILDKLVTHFAGGKKAQFARMLDISPQNLNMWYNNDYLDLEKVYNVCQGVSADWLLTGDGEMMLSSRIPVIGKVIPFIDEDDLLSGEWSNNHSYMVMKDVPLECDFIAKMPNNALREIELYPGSLLFCNIVDTVDLQNHHIYIIKTTIATLFVELTEEIFDKETRTYRFATRRTDLPDMEFTFSDKDILKCAEIDSYTKNHFVENVI